MTQHQHPESLIDKLAASLNDDGADLALPSDEVEADDAVRFTDLGIDVSQSTPAELASFTRAEIERFAKVIRDTGIRVD